jgi:hypothetical protein
VRPRTSAPCTGPTITLTLEGGPYLTEFQSFWVKAIRHFDPTKPRQRCLRGSFFSHAGERVPPMNRPVPYVLPAEAEAVYVYGKSSAGAEHDVHAVLVPDAGAALTLPLTVATDEKDQDVARLAALLDAAPWTFASTDLKNPHFYTRRSDWPDEEAFNFAVRASRRLGHREKYFPPGAVKAAYSETVFHSGIHKVWSFWQPFPGWINRKPLAPPVEARVVDQTLLVHDARLIEIPTLSDGFAGLDPTITRCRHFQAGVHLCGYVAPDADIRPRLRKRQ